MDIDYVSLPEPQIIRERIEQVSREDMQIFLKAVYLTASSPIELAGELTSNDRNMANTRKLLVLMGMMCFYPR
jgi:hypothetical protein